MSLWRLRRGLSSISRLTAVAVAQVLSLSCTVTSNHVHLHAALQAEDLPAACLRSHDLLYLSPQSVAPRTCLAVPDALCLQTASGRELLHLRGSNGCLRPYSSQSIPEARMQASTATPAEQALHDAAASAILDVRSSVPSTGSARILRPGACL